MKEYLKGFGGVGYFKTVSDENSGYSVTGTRKAIESAVSCSKADNRTVQAIAADDNPNWDVDSELTDTTLTMVFRQVPLDTLADLTGGSVSTDGTFEEGAFDEAPMRALTFCGLKKGGGYRGYRYYCCRLQSYEYTLQTKGTASGQVADVTLTWRCSPRAADGKIRGSKDFSTVSACQTWLASIPTVGETSDKPPVQAFDTLAQVSSLPTEDIDMRTLYILTSAVSVSGTSYSAGDCLYYTGTAWAKY